MVAQRNENEENPGAKDIYTLGTVAQILRVLKMPDGNTTIIIQGKKRLKLVQEISDDPYLIASIEEFDEKSLK